MERRSTQKQATLYKLYFPIQYHYIRQDKDGFTALHIAAGYLHEKVVEVLVESGADPEIQDNTGRSPLDLVETLKRNIPATTVTFARRSVLESISHTIERFVYEEVPPAAIKGVRPAGDLGDEYLIEWLDGMLPCGFHVLKS